VISGEGDGHGLEAQEEALEQHGESHRVVHWEQWGQRPPSNTERVGRGEGANGADGDARDRNGEQSCVVTVCGVEIDSREVDQRGDEITTGNKPLSVPGTDPRRGREHPTSGGVGPAHLSSVVLRGHDGGGLWRLSQGKLGEHGAEGAE